MTRHQIVELTPVTFPITVAIEAPRNSLNSRTLAVLNSYFFFSSLKRLNGSSLFLTWQQFVCVAQEGPFYRVKLEHIFEGK